MKVNDPGYEEGMVSCPPPSAFIREQDIDVFQIDSDDDDDEVEGDVEMQSPSISVEAALHALKSGSTNNSDHCDGNNRESRHGIPHDHHDEFSHILYTTPVDVDYAEATIVAPADLPEGSIMRVYMGMHRIIVVEVPQGGVNAGDTFKAPYRIHRLALSPLEEFRERSYKDGHYHGWMANLFGCCEFGPLHSSFTGAFCCPCQAFLLLKVMTRMHLNWYGKYTFPTSNSTRRRGQRYAIACIVSTYMVAFVLNAILLWHLITTLYNSEKAHQLIADNTGFLFNNSDDGRAIEKEELDEEVSVHCSKAQDDSDIFCHQTINMPLVLSIMSIDAILYSYILVLFTRTRSALREQHFIHGDVMHDCCASFLCNCCVLSQLARECSECDEQGSARFFNDGWESVCMDEMGHENNNGSEIRQTIDQGKNIEFVELS